MMTPRVLGSRSHARNAVACRKKRSGASAGILIDSNVCQMSQRGVSSVAEEFFVCKFYSARFFLVRTLFFKQAGRAVFVVHFFPPRKKVNTSASATGGYLTLISCTSSVVRQAYRTDGRPSIIRRWQRYRERQRKYCRTPLDRASLPVYIPVLARMEKYSPRPSFRHKSSRLEHLAKKGRTRSMWPRCRADADESNYSINAAQRFRRQKKK